MAAIAAVDGVEAAIRESEPMVDRQDQRKENLRRSGQYLIYIGEYGKAADLLQAGAADGDSAHLSDVELLRHTVGDAPFQYLQVRLLNGHPIRCETCAFDVEFTVRSAILDEAVKERIPVYFTHVTDIPVPLMFREVVQSSNKLPALRFLFFLLIHGVTRLASPAFSLVEGGGY